MPGRFDLYHADALHATDLVYQPIFPFTVQTTPLDEAVTGALAAVKGVKAAFEKHANKEGLAGSIEKADKALQKVGDNDIERLLLSKPEIRSYLLAVAVIDLDADTDKPRSLAATAAGLLAAGVKPDLKVLGVSAKDPWNRFFKVIVERTVAVNNLKATQGERKAIAETLREDPPPLSGSTVLQRIRREISLKTDPAEKALKEWISREEIPKDLTEQPGVKDAMREYVKGLGVDFDDSKHGEYDEYFALAFERASKRLQTADDPIQSKFTGAINDLDFDVDPLTGFHDPQVLRKNIKAAGMLDYIYVLGEQLGVFRLCDTLVLRWANGALDIPDGAAADKLYQYWKLTDDRSSEDERGLLYRRILSKGKTKALSGMVLNDEFSVLWGNLMKEVVDFVDKSETTSVDDRGPSKNRLVRHTTQLQYNLSEHMTGMAQVQTAEIYAQLRDALEILADPQVVAILAGGRRRSLWTVIERLHRYEGRSINVEALRTVAVEGNRVFGWIAEFVDGDEGTAAFEDDLLIPAERYILASASVNDETPDFDEPDDDFDDEFDDEFDDFDDEF